MLTEPSEKRISRIICDCGIPVCGFTPFDDIKDKLLPSSKKRLIPEKAHTVISMLFPYYSGEHCGNISKYAMPEDYHTSVMEKLQKASGRLLETFPESEFVPFCDASPVPEVYAAALAGLGRIGLNCLLISYKYGSFVFIGEIVTDLIIPARHTDIINCTGCGRCVKKCPSGALNGKSLDKNKCLSYITQKKGALSEYEQQLLKNSGCIWGCDICQDVCPLNLNILQTGLSEFSENLKTTITETELCDEQFEAKNSRRAFLWKGPEVLKRNLRLAGQKLM